MAAVNVDSAAFLFVHDDLKRDRDVVMSAVQKDGSLLRYVHDTSASGYSGGNNVFKVAALFIAISTTACYLLNAVFSYWLTYAFDVYSSISPQTSSATVAQVSTINQDDTVHLENFIKCSILDDSMCYDGFDQYNLCCFVYDGDKPIIKTRRSSYPWK
jgi:hypothetical protein